MTPHPSPPRSTRPAKLPDWIDDEDDEDDPHMQRWCSCPFDCPNCPGCDCCNCQTDHTEDDDESH